MTAPLPPPWGAPAAPAAAAPLPLLALLLAAGLLNQLSGTVASPAAPPAAARDAALDAAPDAASDGYFDVEGAAPLLLARLRAWDAAPAPAYLLDDPDAQGGAGGLSSAGAQRVKRTGPSLSIVAPLDVLRQRLMAEINRRRMRESEAHRIANNRVLLNSVGKRVPIRLPAPGSLWGSSWDERFAVEQA